MKLLDVEVEDGYEICLSCTEPDCRWNDTRYGWSCPLKEFKDKNNERRKETNGKGNGR